VECTRPTHQVVYLLQTVDAVVVVRPPLVVLVLKATTVLLQILTRVAVEGARGQVPLVQPEAQECSITETTTAEEVVVAGNMSAPAWGELEGVEMEAVVRTHEWVLHLRGFQTQVAAEVVGVRVNRLSRVARGAVRVGLEFLSRRTFTRNYAFNYTPR
jgi:hypothetical protein